MSEQHFCLVALEPGQPAEVDAVDVGDVAAEVYAARRRVLTPQSVRDLCQSRVRERYRLQRVRQGVMEL